MNPFDAIEVLRTEHATPPTRAQQRGIEAEALRHRLQHKFEQRQVERLPRDWQHRLLSEHARHAAQKRDDALADANRWLLAKVERINKHFEPCRLAPDASDDDFRVAAEKFAERCARIAERWRKPAAIVREIAALCRRHEIDPPKGQTESAIIKRALDPLWWSRQLRVAHGRALEACAIETGRVRKGDGLYISDESFRRRKQQARRNAAMLAATDAISEDGEVLSLDEIAKGSLANPAKRRAELMTRIKGQDAIAGRLGYIASFIVVTCPSRMHARLAASGEANPNYDGTTPKQAQHYLCRMWSRIRPKLERVGVVCFGMRTVEPHHDGTPHWNILAFASEADMPRLIAVIREYALRDSPDEPGAQKRRVRVEKIDPTKGSAVGYIAKYIAKNIDGHGVGLDHEGEQDASETAARAVAWASIWGIRQFQDFGCPPVGIWRELRRIPEAEMAKAPDCMRQAWHAAQRKGDQLADYAGYIEAQGKPGTKRCNWNNQLHREPTEQLSRYGEPRGARPAGVTAAGIVCRSERKAWILQRRARPRAPWTRVNNCTTAPPQPHRRMALQPGEALRIESSEWFSAPPNGPPLSVFADSTRITTNHHPTP